MIAALMIFVIYLGFYYTIRIACAVERSLKRGGK